MEVKRQSCYSMSMSIGYTIDMKYDIWINLGWGGFCECFLGGYIFLDAQIFRLSSILKSIILTPAHCRSHIPSRCTLYGSNGEMLNVPIRILFLHRKINLLFKQFVTVGCRLWAMLKVEWFPIYRRLCHDNNAINLNLMKIDSAIWVLHEMLAIRYTLYHITYTLYLMMDINLFIVILHSTRIIRVMTVSCESLLLKNRHSDIFWIDNLTNLKFLPSTRERKSIAHCTKSRMCGVVARWY